MLMNLSEIILTRECIPGIQKEFEIVKEYLPEITLEEINNIGKTWTTDENMVALITAQEKDGVKFRTRSRYRILSKSVKTKKIEAYVDAVSDVPLLAAVPVATSVVKRSDDKKFGFTELTFANGVRMILKSDRL